LSGLTVQEREDIVDEIRAHVEERVAGSGFSVEETLRRLGPVEDLARDYTNGALVKRTNRSLSPLPVLRAARAWAMTGFHGVLAFVVALLGYSLGLGFMVCAMLKPLFPEQVGLWMSPHEFRFGFEPEHAPARELLGPWFVQVTVVLGVLIFIGTTIVMRSLLPRLRHWKQAARRQSDPPAADMQAGQAGAR
jgi:hypothetical protein